MRTGGWIGVCLAAAVGAAGCAPSLYAPARATRPYPQSLHTTNVADMHVFREDTELVVVNSTVQDYADFDLWINQRYVSRVESLPAGKIKRLSLWKFVDERGDVFNAGGFFRSFEPTPVRLVEIQTAEAEPMVGLIAIRAERE